MLPQQLISAAEFGISVVFVLFFCIILYNIWLAAYSRQMSVCVHVLACGTHVVGSSWHWLKVLFLRFNTMTIPGGYTTPTALLGYN